MPRIASQTALIVAILSSAVSCTPPKTSLEAQAQAITLAADLHVQFTKAADAANRSVMADTDDASVAFAREANEAAASADKDIGELRRSLTTLSYSPELQFLDTFDKQFAEYRALDKQVLDLAVENTNLKAQRVSFGPARDAASAFASAAESAARSASPPNAAPAEALAETAVAAVRQIEVLQAPHIAASEDEAMTRMEQEMSAAEKQARDAMRRLAALVANGSVLKTAETALDEFMRLNAQVVALSRRNTNVRSLALSLGRKRMLAAAGDDTLRALDEALGKRGFAATR